MKTTNKILAIILAILMVMSIIPLTASAADPISGTCGENITWEFDGETGVLTISGTGDMYDYSYYNRPWESYVDNIKTVVINNGVTTIGNYAFDDCKNLTSITIPESVTTLGDYVFGYCDSLKSVTIPESVKTIGDNAFYYCENLKSIIIPDSVTKIGDGAFSECVRLTEVVLGKNITTINVGTFYHCINLSKIVIDKSVTTIGKSAFGQCVNLKTVYYSGTPTQWGKISIDDSNTYLFNAIIHCDYNSNIYSYSVISETDKTIMITKYNILGPIRELVIPSEIDGYTVVAIDGYVFRGYDTIIHLQLPNTLKTIGKRAFYDCDGLKDLVFPDSLTTIGQYAFAYCDSLKKLTFPDSVTRIDEYAFYECSSLETITLGTNIDTIGEKAFQRCAKMTDVYYKGTEEQWNQISIGEINFYFNGGEQTINFEYKPEGEPEDNAYKTVTGTCGDNLTWELNEITGLLTVSGEGPMYDYESQSDVPWKDYRGTIENIVICDGVTSIGECAFINCKTVKNISMADSVTKIGFWAFYNCYSLTDVVISKGVTKLEQYAFYCCHNLRWVTIDKTVKRIHQYAFASCFEITDLYYLGSKKDWSNMSIGYQCIPGDSVVHYLGEDTHECDDEYIYDSVVTAPTCTEKGYTTYICRCGKTYVDNYVDVDKNNHSYTSEITTSATHTTTGVMTYTCTCGDTYTEVIEKLEKHNYESVVTAPTCTERGYTTHTCICGDSYVGDYAEALGHSYTSEMTTPATHTETGVMTYTCDCGDTYTEVIAKLGKHNYESVVIAPTCTERGYTTYTCVCGDSYVADYVDATGHTEEIITAVEPTCTETGLTAGAKCSACGETLTEQKELPANGHTPANTVEENYVAPTCTENGIKDVVVYCSVCDEEISRDTVVINATGHADNDGDGYCDADNELLDPSVECECNCHKDGITNFFFKLILFFQRILGSNKECSCGVMHY